LAVASSDPNTGPDSRYGNFPAQGAGNKTSGAVFRVSTVGYTNIAISWDHYNISTGSKY
jgi:hypothetical protein